MVSRGQNGHYRSTSRRQWSARGSSTSRGPVRRPTLELPPLLRSELPNLDVNRIRFGDGLATFLDWDAWCSRIQDDRAAR